MKKIIGIDYGSKLAGTTAICYEANNSLHLLQSEKKKDADAFVKSFCGEYQPDHIYIDAPLSLPLVYRGDEKANDFFYRQADRETKAMSPMFLGGLPARAMKLDHELTAISHEAYPKMLVSFLKLNRHYKNDIPQFLKELNQLMKIDTLLNANNWHQVDAILAYITGVRHQHGEALIYGDTKEGLIFV